MNTLQNQTTPIISSLKRNLSFNCSEKELSLIVNNQNYFDERASNSQLPQINEVNLELSRREKDKLFTISLKYNLDQMGNQDMNFAAFISTEIDSFCIVISEDMKFEELNKESLATILYFAAKSSNDKLSIVISRKNPQYFCFLKGLLAVGFKPSTKDLKNYESKDFKIMTMLIDQNSKPNEIQELYF